MKQDFGLVRDLLFCFEEKSDYSPIESPEIDGHDKSEIMYHLRLLYDAGFLCCEVTTTKSIDRTI